MPVSRTFFTYSFGSPTHKTPPESRKRAPAERCSISRALFPLSLNVPSKRTSPRPTNFTDEASRERETFSRTFHNSSHDNSTFAQSPRKGVHPYSTAESLWREILCLQSQWFIHLFMPVRVPKKELFLEMRKNSHRPRGPTRKEGVRTMV